jgi:hypothetical protein
MARSRDISKVFSTNTALATDSEVSGLYLTQSSASTVYQTKSATGLTLISPSTIANTSGTASIGTNGTVTFSGVSSISLNNVFSSTYENYRIVGLITGMSTNAMLARMRASGSDNTTSNHFYGAFYVTASGSSGVDYSGNSQTSLTLSRRDSEFYIDMNGPAQSRPTTFQGRYYDRNQGRWGFVGANQTESLSFDSMTFFPAASTFSGSISILAYNK